MRHFSSTKPSPRYRPVNALASRPVARYQRPPRAYSPTKTRAVPATMRPMLSALPACPMRFSVRVSPITMKPAKVRMFMPSRMSLVSDPPSLAPTRAPERPRMISRVGFGVRPRCYRAYGVLCSPASTRGSGSSSRTLNTPGRLGLRPGAPPGNKCAHQCRIGEIDREGVI